MTQLRVSEVAELLGVSTDTVRRAIEAGRLTSTRDGSGRVTVPGTEVAALGQEESHAPAVGALGRTSPRNQMRGIVTRVVTDTVMAQVEIQAGPFRIVSLVSSESVQEMGLEVGTVAVASIKATHVTLGVPS